MCNRYPRKILLLAALSVIGPIASAQSDASACGNPFVAHFGPWDYRSASKENLSIVERIHFKPGTERLADRHTNLGGDLSYTLIVFPNHHRALIAMAKLADQHKTDRPPGQNLTIDCYFIRALQYRPDDTVVRLLYAQHLAKKGEAEAARQHVLQARKHVGELPISIYNVGLVAFDLGFMDIAKEAARDAAEAGFPRTELRDKLAKAGHAVAPPAQAASTASAGQ